MYVDRNSTERFWDVLISVASSPIFPHAVLGDLFSIALDPCTPVLRRERVQVADPHNTADTVKSMYILTLRFSCSLSNIIYFHEIVEANMHIICIL